jgi:hypothetical protein
MNPTQKNHAAQAPKPYLVSGGAKNKYGAICKCHTEIDLWRPAETDKQKLCATN